MDMNLKAILFSSVEEARPKGPHIERLHLYEISIGGKAKKS